jgi:MarR family transcriptional regulator for hemolysin
MPPAAAKPWDPESTASFWINVASRALLRHFDAHLRPFGFAMSHLPVLRALLDGRARSQTELAHAARVEQPTMAETLARMVRDGVVQREPNPDDRRGTLISITRQSRARLAKAKAALMEAERQAMAGISDEEQAVLRVLLQRVAKNLEESGRAPSPGSSTQRGEP